MYPPATLVTVWGQKPAVILECVNRTYEPTETSDFFKDLLSQEYFKLYFELNWHNNTIVIWVYLLWNETASTYFTFLLMEFKLKLSLF